MSKAKRKKRSRKRQKRKARSRRRQRAKAILTSKQMSAFLDAFGGPTQAVADAYASSPLTKGV